MLITVENKEIINSRKIRTHDGLINKFDYKYYERNCIIQIVNKTWGKQQIINIKNIICLDVQSCEFWGQCPNLNCWFCDGKQPKIKELLGVKVGGIHPISLLEENPDKYFEHVFQFISGDEMRFVCEEVEVQEYEYYEE